MKRIYATLALIGSFAVSAFAQRSADWQIVVVSPAEGATVQLNSTNPADSTDIEYLFINNGPDSITSLDTILFQDPLSGGNITNLYLTDDTAKVRMGDTVSFGRGKIQLTSEDIEDGPGSWCAIAFILDGVTNDLMIDVDTTNNRSCNSITWHNKPTGIGSIKGLDKYALQVYPNPAANTVSFSATMVNGNATVRISDIAGRTALVKDFGKQIAGDKKFTLDISALNAGMYYIELVNGEKRAISKLSVQKH